MLKQILALGVSAFLIVPALTAAEAASETKAEAKTEAKAEETTASTKAEAVEEAKEVAKTAPKEELKDGSEATVGHKSPGLAGGLAFFPGIAVHGAGHMYAGSWMKGFGLLAIEGVAIGVAAAQISGGISEFSDLAKGMEGGKFPTDASGTFTKVGILAVSTVAFLVTWFDDMAGAPIAANEYNRLADENAQAARFQLQPRYDGAALALSTEF